ncbi:heme o synthase [Sulfobacillus thermosulfidooxidans]|uniref:heme o synthase n=1 Tax=Sulfobacillus thermosulfidooxidans TaxID=28034 RepID=UPI000418B842|nr:heme o synthase [Sulfobacillus thermosulfidooxidans]
MYAQSVPVSRSVTTTILDYITLMKPRIISLLLITAYCAMVVAAGHLPSLRLTVLTMLGLTLSSGGAHAVNMWYDRDIDQIMRRTKMRPVAQGRVPAVHSLIFGIILQVISFVGLGMLVNWTTALCSLGGFLFYVFIYTIWLKRRTPQNIVIGGAAGAFPPLVGWAAVTGNVGLPAILMFLIIFLWTPPHFWALALYKQDDYRNAGIPMMPVVRGERVTKTQSMIYAWLLLAASIGLYFTGTVSGIYLIIAIVLGVTFIGYHVYLLQEHEPEIKWAKKTFKFSLLYMMGIFFAMIVALPHH